MIDVLAGPRGRNSGIGRALAGQVAGAAALCFVVAAAVWLIFQTGGGARSDVRLESASAARARELSVAIHTVLDAARLVDFVGPEDERAAERLEDAWKVLALVNDRERAQLEVAMGKRPPLMSAPPLELDSSAREEALVRSAMTYLEAALADRDLRALERAFDLLEMSRD